MSTRCSAVCSSFVLASSLVFASATAGLPDSQTAYLGTWQAVLEIDLSTGNRTTLSSEFVGSGDPFFVDSADRVTSLLIEDEDSLIVSTRKHFFRISRLDGSRTLLDADPFTDGLPPLYADQIIDLQWESPGVALVLLESPTTTRVSRLNIATMTATPVVVSGPAPDLTFSTYGATLLKEAGDTALLMDFAGQKLLRINLTDGTKGKLNDDPLPFASAFVHLGSDEYLLGSISPSGFGRFASTTSTYTPLSPGGPPYTGTPVSMARHQDGTIYVYDGILPAIFSVDPTTGARTLISGGPMGTGAPLPTGSHSDPAQLVLPAASEARTADWMLHH